MELMTTVTLMIKYDLIMIKLQLIYQTPWMCVSICEHFLVDIFK